MADVNAAYARAECVVIQAPTPNVSVRADACLYKVRGAWSFGSEPGIVAPPQSIRPTRIYARDDTEIAAPAQVGDPCTLTRKPDGTLKLFMQTEVYGEEDCEP